MKVEQAVLPKHETQSATRARDPSIRPASGSSSTGIAVVKQKESPWQKHWSEMQAKVSKAILKLQGFAARQT